MLRLPKRDMLRGGRASKEHRKVSSFNARELRRGMKHEMEHTDDWRVARRIAMDHLTEDPRYYQKLAKIERDPGPRMFPVPQAVGKEARWALWAHAAFKRGGTHVGLNTARMLGFPVKHNGDRSADARVGLETRAKISLRKVRHINRYFARHEVDKKAVGWRRGEKGYPSPGRIAWGLWGGYPAWEWTDKILRRYGRK